MSSMPSTSVNMRTCRICLDAESEFRITLDSEWSKSFEFCFGVPVFVKYAPLVICGRCALDLKKYEKFKQQCLKSQAMWGSIMKVNCCTTNCIQAEIKENPTDEHLSDHSYNDGEIYTSSTIKEECIDNDNLDINFIKMEADLDVVKHENLETQCDNRSVNSDNIKMKSKKSKDTTVFKKKHNLQTAMQCSKCGKGYVRKKFLLKHLKICHDKDFIDHDKDFIQVKRKIAAFPKTKVKPCCGICDFPSTDSETVKKHFNEHYANNDLSCKLCDYVGRDFADMVSHRYNHIPRSSKLKMYCPICSKRFYAALSIQFHYRKVHMRKPGGLCPVCNKVIICYRKFRYHVALHKSTKYICDHCGERFLYRGNIKTHLKDHSNLREFVCETCGNAFKRAAALKGHIEALHMPNVPVVCSHCNRTFKNEKCLNKHVRLIGMEKKFVCSICSKGYPTRKLLNVHEIWHSGERPFCCETCGARFKSKCHLKCHISSHSGLKPYECKICTKSFTYSQALKRHQSVHTGIRNIKCLHCDRTFYSKQMMLGHCISKHKDVTNKSH